MKKYTFGKLLELIKDKLNKDEVGIAADISERIKNQPFYKKVVEKKGKDKEISSATIKGWIYSGKKPDNILEIKIKDIIIDYFCDEVCDDKRNAEIEKCITNYIPNYCNLKVAERDYLIKDLELKEILDKAWMISFDKDFTVGPDDYRGELIGVPALPKNYLVRSDYINKIKKEIFKHKNAGVANHALILGVHGMGGVGKTILAVAVARDQEINQAFSDGIYWVTLGKEVDIVDKQRIIFSESNTSPQYFNDVEGGKIELQKFFFNKKCLLILDDVWEARQVKAFNVLNNNCCILITTRIKSLIDSFYGQTVPVDLVNISEAKEILAKSAEQNIEELPEFIETIIKKCGSLVLALSIVGAQVRCKNDKYKGWANVLEKLDDNKNLGSIPEYQHEDYDAAIKIGLDNLDEKIKELYFDFAVFQEDQSIPKGVLKTFWGNRIKEYEFEEYLEILVNHSLLIKDNQNNYIIHDLLHDYLRRQPGMNMPSRHELLLSSYEKLIGSREWYNGPDDGYFFKSLFWHLKQAGHDEEINELLWNPKWYKSKIRNANVFELIYDIRYVQKELMANKDALELVKQALYLSSHIIDEDLTQFESQLTGRLIGFENTKIQGLLEKLIKYNCNKWLRPISISLAPPGGPLLRTLNGHTSRVNHVAMTPDGKAVSASWDKTLKVWDIETGEVLHTLEGHKSYVNHVVVIQNNIAVSASADKTLKVWNIETGKAMFFLTGHKSCINHIAVVPEGKVVSASDDCTLKVWDIEKGIELCTLSGHTSRISHIAVTPDGKVVSASDDCTLKVWDIEKGIELCTLSGHTSRINHVAVTPDGKVVSASDDATLKIWNVETGEEPCTLEGHTSRVNHLAVTNDGKIVSASDDSTLKVWDIKTGEELFTFKCDCSPVKYVTLTDSKVVSISVNSTMKVWDIYERKELSTLKGHSSPIRHVVITPDDKIISASVDSTLKIWDITKTDKLYTLSGHDSSVNNLSVTSNKVVSASADATLKVWDIENGKELLTLKGHREPVKYVATIENKVISASLDKTLKVWDIETGDELLTLQGHSDWVNHMAVAPGGKIVSASKDSTLRVWNLYTGEELLRFEGHSGNVNYVAVTTDGKVVSSSGNTIIVWDIMTGEKLAELCGHKLLVNHMVMLPGNKVISASVDSTLKVWDISDGKLLATLEGHKSSVNYVAMVSDNIIVSASDDSMAKVWDIKNRKEIFTMHIGSAWIKDITVSSDGKLFLASDTLKIWDIKKRKEIATYKGDYFFRTVKFDEARNLVIAGDSWGNIHFLKMENF